MNLAEKIQFHRDEDLRFSRLAMAHRLRARRLLAHTDTIERRTRFAQAIKGSGILAAEFLGINPNAFYNRLWQYKQAAVTSLILLFLSFGFTCWAQPRGAEVWKQSFSRTSYQRQESGKHARIATNDVQSPMLAAATLSPFALSATPLSSTLPRQTNYNVPLAWNHSVSALVRGYRIYITNTRTNPVWRLAAMVGYTNAATITNVIPPVWFACRAIDADGDESLDSNIAGMLGVDKILTVWSEVSSNLTGWSYLAPVVTKTNPVGAEYFRTGAKLVNQWRTE